MQAEQLADFTWAFDVVHPDADRRRAAIEREKGYQDDWARLHSWSRIVRPARATSCPIRAWSPSTTRPRPPSATCTPGCSPPRSGTT
ncbi:hypothetical protein ACFQZ4_51780 [Catellatospora coxensis]